MTKSMTDALVGIAISEGEIDSVDESAADFIPEWRETRKEEITLRNLLSITSGLLWNTREQLPEKGTKGKQK